MVLRTRATITTTMVKQYDNMQLGNLQVIRNFSREAFKGSNGDAKCVTEILWATKIRTLGGKGQNLVDKHL